MGYIEQLGEGNRKDTMSAGTIYGGFAEQVQKYPHAIAVRDENGQLTYQQLEALATNIRAHLPKSPPYLGIIMDHGKEMIATILAVLKSGAAYVPAEPDFPVERIRFMMKESGVGCVITQKEYAERLAGLPLLFIEDLMPERKTTPDDLHEPPTAEDESAPDGVAYVLYTSGSTGVPKGVIVENRQVCHYTSAFKNEFATTPADTMLQYSVCTFDIFVEEVFTTLLSGATLAIPSAPTRQDLPALMRFVEKCGVTIISGFPYLLFDMNSLESIPAGIRLLISGGDTLRASYVDNLLPYAKVYNTYGPSETTVCAAYYLCNGNKPLNDGTYPVGKAIPGSSITLLDENLEPVLPGETGEICIAGDGVSRGYTDPLMNEAFITLADGIRYYRSGDLGRLLPDGNLAFLRRKDTQVMILGHRVEPDEVESVLCGCEEVATGLVRAETDESGLSYLIAYVVPASEEFCLSAVREKMARFLTPYMIPEFFVKVSHIPLTPNGKPDRGELPVVLKVGDYA